VLTAELQRTLRLRREFLDDAEFAEAARKEEFQIKSYPQIRHRWDRLPEG